MSQTDRSAGSHSSGDGRRHDERRLSQSHDHRDNHGQTPAAWTAVVVMFVGFLTGAVAVVVARPWLFAVGVVLVLLGPVVGKVMQAMGLGQPPGYHQGSDYGQRTHAEDVANRPRG